MNTYRTKRHLVEVDLDEEQHRSKRHHLKVDHLLALFWESIHGDHDCVPKNPVLKLLSNMCLKDLCRMRCVSRVWNNLICNKEFWNALPDGCEARLSCNFFLRSTGEAAHNIQIYNTLDSDQVTTTGSQEVTRRHLIPVTLLSSVLGPGHDKDIICHIAASSHGLLCLMVLPYEVDIKAERAHSAGYKLVVMNPLRATNYRVLDDPIARFTSEQIRNDFRSCLNIYSLEIITDFSASDSDTGSYHYMVIMHNLLAGPCSTLVYHSRTRHWSSFPVSYDDTTITTSFSLIQKADVFHLHSKLQRYQVLDDQCLLGVVFWGLHLSGPCPSRYKLFGIVDFFLPIHEMLNDTHLCFRYKDRIIVAAPLASDEVIEKESRRYNVLLLQGFILYELQYNSPQKHNLVSLNKVELTRTPSQYWVKSFYPSIDEMSTALTTYDHVCSFYLTAQGIICCITKVYDNVGSLEGYRYLAYDLNQDEWLVLHDSLQDPKFCHNRFQKSNKYCAGFQASLLANV